MWRKGRSARYELTKQRSKNTVLYIQLWYSRCLTARWKPALISLGPKTPRRLSIISAHYCCREERKGEGASFESLVSERIRFCVPRTREREREIAGGTGRRREKDGHNTLREIAGSSLGRRTVSWGISREWLVPVTTFDKRSRSAPTNPSIPIFRLEPWITIYIYMCVASVALQLGRDWTARWKETMARFDNSPSSQEILDCFVSNPPFPAEPCFTNSQEQRNP